jgi:hypothetical protein
MVANLPTFSKRCKLLKGHLKLRASVDGIALPKAQGRCMTMRRIFWWAMLSGVLTIATNLSAQSSLEVPLSFRPFQNPDEAILLSLGGVVDSLSSRPPKGYRAPSGVSLPHFFALSLESGTLVGMVAKSSPSAKDPDRLWLDWNGDKNFTGDEKLMGTAQRKGDERFVVFGPVKHPFGDGQLEGLFILHDGDHLHLLPTGYYEGEVTLGERKVKIGIADTNLNGKLGDRTGGMEQEGDALLVDFDGDGTFGSPADLALGAVESLEAEVYYLTALTQMPDGNFYRLKVAEDGSRLWLTREDLPTGKVRMACERFLLGLTGEGGVLLVRGRDSEATLPVGSYQVFWVVMGKADGQGKIWRAMLIFARKSARLRVAAEKITDLPFGPPFKLNLSAEPSGREWNFSLTLEDKAGNELTGISTPDGKRPPEPTLTITDAQGKVIKTEKFHYG